MRQRFKDVIVFNTEQIGDKRYTQGTLALLTDDVETLRPGFIYRNKNTRRIILQTEHQDVKLDVYESLHPIFYSNDENVHEGDLVYDLQHKEIYHPTEEAIHAKQEYLRKVIVVWIQFPKSALTDIAEETLTEGDQRLILCENDYSSVPENMGSLWRAYVDSKIALSTEGFVTIRPLETIRSKAIQYALNTTEVRAEEHFINGYQQCLHDMKNK